MHPTEFTNYAEDSCFTESYKLSYRKNKSNERRAHVTDNGTFAEAKRVFIPALELVDVNVFVDSAYGMEEYPGIRECVVKEDSGFSDRVLLVKHQKDW
jgi:hypothetical protein